MPLARRDKILGDAPPATEKEKVNRLRRIHGKLILRGARQTKEGDRVYLVNGLEGRCTATRLEGRFR